MFYCETLAPGLKQVFEDIELISNVKIVTLNSYHNVLHMYICFCDKGINYGCSFCKMSPPMHVFDGVESNFRLKFVIGNGLVLIAYSDLNKNNE